MHCRFLFFCACVYMHNRSTLIHATFWLRYVISLTVSLARSCRWRVHAEERPMHASPKIYVQWDIPLFVSSFSFCPPSFRCTLSHLWRIWYRSHFRDWEICCLFVHSPRVSVFAIFKKWHPVFSNFIHLIQSCAPKLAGISKGLWRQPLSLGSCLSDRN